MRRCIYCLEVKGIDAFNREHIMPQAFGTFEGAESDPVTLDCVCTVCNQTFGDTLDRALSRDCVLGLLRYSEGVRDPRKFKPPSREADMTITPTDGDLADGVRLRLGAGADGTFGFHVEELIGFASQSGGEYEYFPLDALPSPSEVQARFGPRPRFDTQGLSHEQAQTVLHDTLGFLFEITHEAPAPQRAEVNIPIGRLQFRAVAKIAFNYFAWVMGARVACMPDFNGLRVYIGYGKRLGPTHVSVGIVAIDVLDGERKPRRGHFITVQNGELGFLSQVSLFSAIRFRVDLMHVPLAVMVPCDDGHFYDLDTRRVERIHVPPAGGPVALPPPLGVQLKINR
jgi:hypothetical protein